MCYNKKADIPRLSLLWSLWTQPSYPYVGGFETTHILSLAGSLALLWLFTFAVDFLPSDEPNVFLPHQAVKGAISRHSMLKYNWGEAVTPKFSYCWVVARIALLRDEAIRPASKSSDSWALGL